MMSEQLIKFEFTQINIDFIFSDELNTNTIFFNDDLIANISLFDEL